MNIKVIVKNEDDQKYADILEYAINKEIYPGIIGAMVHYGTEMIEYLLETKQYARAWDAINGKLDEEEIVMDKAAYDRVYGDKSI